MPLLNKNHDSICFKYLLLCKLVLLIAIPYSCHESTVERKIERSFYHWKSSVKITSFELKQLHALRVKTIYLKFFDIDWEVSSKQAVPTAKVQVPDNQQLSGYHIIPTVFITNACIQQLDSSKIKLLAGKIYDLITATCQTYKIGNTHEIQIDCDWTAATGKKYFSLLSYIKQLSRCQLSATIRLHQVKYFYKTGVPPVDRGLLMCYNMGNLKNINTKNSIIETGELKKYTGNLSSYPLPLDVAFPLFEWKVLFRNNIYQGLLKNIPGSFFNHSFSLEKNGRIEILRDTLLEGYNLKKGDLLRIEESHVQELLATAKEINKHLKNTPMRISLYHLDSVTLSKFTTNELESIYSLLR